MNWGQAVLAAVAGAACATFIYASLKVIGRVPVFEEGPSYGGLGPWFGWRTLLHVLLLLLLCVAAFGISSTLPVRTLGVGWLRSSLSGIAAHVTALIIAAGIIGLLNRLILPNLAATPRQPEDLATLFFVIGTALTLMFAVRTFSLPLVVATVMVAAVALPLAPIFGGYVGLIAWIILPAVAALSQSSSNGG